MLQLFPYPAVVVLLWGSQNDLFLGLLGDSFLISSEEALYCLELPYFVAATECQGPIGCRFCTLAVG